MNIVITIPSNIRWEDYQKELDFVKNGRNVLNFKVNSFPRQTTVGERCYLNYKGNVIGWMTITGFSEESFTCKVTGKKWDGKFIQRSGPFHPITTIPMKGFQGFRYFNDSKINESVKDLMKGKSDDEIIKSFGDLDSNELLIKSCKNGYLNGVKIALGRGADPSSGNNYPILYASLNGYTDLVRFFLKDKRVDPSTCDNFAIGYASENGHTEIVKLLLTDPRVDPRFDNNHAIRWASYNGHIEIVKILLQDPRVDPSDFSDFAIKESFRNKHFEIVKLLLQDPRVDPSFDDNFLIRYSLENDYIDIVKLLLNNPRVRKKLTEKEIKEFENK